MSLTREELTSEWVAEYSALIRSQSGFEPLTDSQREASLEETLAKVPPGEDIWLFGYGSLMWNPIVLHEECRPGRIHGFHRRYCFWVEAGRGSREMPGLMLALDRGGSCRGMAFRIAAHRRMEELRLIWMREMLSGVYSPRWVAVHTEQGLVQAVTFVVNRGHRQYAGNLTHHKIASHLARARGRLGTARAYLENTVTQLTEMGVSDGYLTRLLGLVRAEGND